MKKVIISFDSFKETFTSGEICNITKEYLSKRYDYNFICVPISDGGEGFLDCIETNLDCVIKKYTVTNANFEKCIAKVLYYHDLCFIECAEAVGFKHLKKMSRASNTTTLGVGELLKHALEEDVRKIFISLGGTITNDGGCGMLYSLGVRFFDEANVSFIPTGETLGKIKRIDTTNIIKCKDIVLLCDVTNPLLGDNGATKVYAPQKRANFEEINLMEEGMENYARICEECLNKDYKFSTSSGSAGGISFALMSFFDAVVSSGIEEYLKIIDYKSYAKNAEVIITGEGKLDMQSLCGKALSGIAKFANAENIEVVLICGKVDGDIKEYQEYGFHKIYAINDITRPIEDIKMSAKTDLIKTLESVEI